MKNRLIDLRVDGPSRVYIQRNLFVASEINFAASGATPQLPLGILYTREKRGHIGRWDGWQAVSGWVSPKLKSFGGIRERVGGWGWVASRRPFWTHISIVWWLGFSAIRRVSEAGFASPTPHPMCISMCSPSRLLCASSANVLPRNEPFTFQINRHLFLFFFLSVSVSVFYSAGHPNFFWQIMVRNLWIALGGPFFWISISDTWRDTFLTATWWPVEAVIPRMLEMPTKLPLNWLRNAPSNQFNQWGESLTVPNAQVYIRQMNNMRWPKVTGTLHWSVWTSKLPLFNIPNFGIFFFVLYRIVEYKYYAIPI